MNRRAGGNFQLVVAAVCIEVTLHVRHAEVSQFHICPPTNVHFIEDRSADIGTCSISPQGGDKHLMSSLTSIRSLKLLVPDSTSCRNYWSALNETDRRFVQSPPIYFLKWLPLSKCSPLALSCT